MNNAIGIIDSGVGGLSVTSAIVNQLPNESLIYLADSKNCPYGSRPEEEILSLSQRMIDFLLAKEIKALVIACNTITVTSLDKLRMIYPSIPIVGIVPVIKTAVEKSKNKKIGVYSTRVTANSAYQKELINKFASDYEVINVGSEDLVPLVENLDIESIDKVLAQELKPFLEAKIDVLALGCSHFPLVKERIQKILPEVLILDSSEAVARQLEKILAHNNILANPDMPKYNFYTTGNEKGIEYFASRFTNEPKIEKIEL